MRKIIFMLLSYLMFCYISHAQYHNNWGIKGGVNFTGISSSGNNTVFTESSMYMNFLGFDLALFKQWFSSERYNIETELGYSYRGEMTGNPYSALYPVWKKFTYTYVTWYFPDRFQYIYLITKPRIRTGFTVPPFMDNFYFEGGIGLNSIVGSFNSDVDTNVLNIKKWDLEISGLLGLGIEVERFIDIELRFQYFFNGPYTATFGSSKISRNFNCIELLTGIAFNHFFEKPQPKKKNHSREKD